MLLINIIKRKSQLDGPELTLLTVSLQIRSGGINTLFPLSRPTLLKGAAQKLLEKKFILFFTAFT